MVKFLAAGELGDALLVPLKDVISLLVRTKPLNSIVLDCLVLYYLFQCIFLEAATHLGTIEIIVGPCRTARINNWLLRHLLVFIVTRRDVNELGLGLLERA